MTDENKPKEENAEDMWKKHEAYFSEVDILNKSFKKIGASSVILALSGCLLGVGYAHFSKISKPSEVVQLEKARNTIRVLENLEQKAEREGLLILDSTPSDIQRLLNGGVDKDNLNMTLKEYETYAKSLENNPRVIRYIGASNDRTNVSMALCLGPNLTAAGLALGAGVYGHVKDKRLRKKYLSGQN